jgi:hypothetical protein
MKNNGSYVAYGFIALAMILIITLVIIFYKRGLQGFTNPEIGFGNVATKNIKFTNNDSYRLSDILKTPDGKTDRYILNLDGYINIIGFKVNTFKNVNKIIKYRLKVENDLLNEYVAINGNSEFKTGEYYDIRNNNYNINQLLLMNSVNGDLNDLNEIKSIKFYGIRQFDKLIDEDIQITKNYDTKTFNIEFKKLLDVDNIEYYFVVIGKYDNNKEFLSKQIIRLNNNKINFFAELEKLVPKQYIKYPGQQYNQPTITTSTVSELELSDLLGSDEFKNTVIKLKTSQIDKETTLKETAEILIKYRKEELLDVFKLILKNQYLETNKDVHALLININEYSKMKFINSNDTTKETNESFVRKYKQNHYYYQSDEIKGLLKFVFDMIENFEDACNDFNCSITSPQLDILDNYKFPFYYKVGVGYVRLDVLGNEIYSPITSYRENGEVLFTMEKDVSASLKDDELTTGDNLFNKLKMVNNVDVKTLRGVIGSNYPNNFNISEQNLQDYVSLDEYKDNKYSPIHFNINIIDENEPATTTTQQPATTQADTSLFSGNYKNAEETINDLLA